MSHSRILFERSTQHRGETLVQCLVVVQFRQRPALVRLAPYRRALTSHDLPSPMTDATPPERPDLPPLPESPATATDLARLDRARNDLLRVHRALLAVERARYEKVRGRIANNSAFLQLVISDPWFDWLRPMAQLVLMIDERTTDKKSILGTAEARALLDRARGLLRADQEGDAFQRLFFDAVQASPELAVLARQVALGIDGPS